MTKPDPTKRKHIRSKNIYKPNILQESTSTPAPNSQKSSSRKNNLPSRLSKQIEMSRRDLETIHEDTLVNISRVSNVETNEPPTPGLIQLSRQNTQKENDNTQNNYWNDGFDHPSGVI